MTNRNQQPLHHHRRRFLGRILEGTGGFVSLVQFAVNKTEAKHLAEVAIQCIERVVKNQQPVTWERFKQRLITRFRFFFYGNEYHREGMTNSAARQESLDN